MKVALVSDYSGLTDEGTRKTAHYYDKELSKNHGVIHFNVTDMVSPTFWRTLRNFNPHIIHFLPGPTTKSFAIVRMLNLASPKSKTIMSALHPALHPFFKRLIKLLKPNLILVLSEETQSTLDTLGCKTEFLPCGVNLNKFVPVKDRSRIRKKYGVHENDNIILHVGSINQKRNLSIMGILTKKLNVRPIVVGNLSIPSERKVVKDLRDMGSIVIREYIQHIEEVYAMADCYIFPVKNKKGSIELPLTVMEAMACNLPIVSTMFGALPMIFKSGDGLYYVENDEEFVKKIEKVLLNGVIIKTRKKVAPYSWQRIVKRLEKIYEEILTND